LSFPWIIGRALDNAAVQELKDLVLHSAGVFAAGSIASWLRVYCLGTATENIANRLRALLFESLLSQDLEFYEKTPLGKLVK
jgi:ABC-type multidrug transport system fused ATPase/permease subunit